MEFIEKTVFISYRRANVPWAIAINQSLTSLGYDVFFDFWSIRSGDFEQIITENIQSRAHFIILLTPSALERCDELNDWFRREIEIALNSKRNIVPVLLEGFDFRSRATIDYLTGELINIRNYNGLNITAEYYDAGIVKLNKFLSIPLDKVIHPVLHPVSPKIQKIVNEQKRAVTEQAPVDEKVLSAQEWFERAYKSKSSEGQIRLYTKAIELDPKFSFAYNNRGNSYAKLERYERAIEDFNRAIKLNPEYANAYNNRGNSYAELEQYERAIKDYDRAIKLNPGLEGTYNNRGSSYADLEQYERAIKDYDRAIKLNPEDTEAYYNRGSSYADLEQYERAIKDYDRAIKLNPEDTEAYYNRGSSYADLERYERAIKDYDRAIKLNPEFAMAYNNRGISYAKLEQYERAIKDYDRAIKLNPEYAEVYNNRGISYAKLEQYERAIEDYDQAIKLNQENPGFYFNKACLYALKGQAIEATKWLRQTLSKDAEHFCKLARQDSDFDGIRREAVFQKLLEELCDKC